MSEVMDYLVCAVAIGMGPTAVMDIWTAVRKQFLGIPALDYARGPLARLSAARALSP